MVSAVLAVFCLSCSTDNSSGRRDAGARPKRQYTIEEFMNTPRVGGAAFSSDESSILISSDETGIFNAYAIDLRTGQKSTVTRSTNDSTFAITYFPNDNRVLFSRDNGGNEQTHIFLRELDGKERDLTPGEKVKAGFIGWKRDETGFYFRTNGRDPRYFDVYFMDAQTLQPRMVYQNETGHDFGDITDDEAWIALSKPNTTSDSDIYLYRVATKEMKHLSPHDQPTSFEVAAFDPANRYLYYLTDEGREFQRVRRYHLESGKHEEVEDAKWDILFTYFSKHGKYRVTGINEDARTVIRIYETATGKEVRLPKLPEGQISGVTISDTESLMAFYLNPDRSPGDLHLYDFSSKKVRKLTDSLNPAIDPLDLVESRVVRFKSFDGLLIPNILYKPHQATARTKAPALVWVHGGPGGQTRVGYSPLIQYLVNHGYVVLGINNRGSSGYGKTFFTADDQKHGREPLRDCLEAKKYLASLPYVDAERIGIIGGSYGGYMVLAALAFHPEEFAVGVDIFGVSNWLRTLESIPSWWESARNALYKELGHPQSDREMLRAISPLFHADKIRRPLMVLQGANDPRVIKAESDDIVAAVKKNNVPVEYIIFEDEGHGFTKKKNQITGNRATLEFLDRYLKNAPRPAS